MPFSNHLMYRKFIFDAWCIAALIWGWQQGIVWPLFETDTSGICYGLVVLFLIGQASLYSRCLKITKAKNDHKAGEKTKILLKPTSFIAKSAHLGDIMKALTAIGFIGTLYGLSMVIRSLDPTVDYEVSMALLKEGGSIAVNTSIVGAVAGLWMLAGRRMLITAIVTLISDAGSVK